MPIFVVCKACRARFQVSDKYAGKSGPCPKCKAVITIPGKSEEVKVHGGEDFARGGRDSAGKLVLKPIARQEVRFRPFTAVLVAAIALVALVVAGMAGSLIRDYLLVRAVGLLLISPPIILAAYTFLRDDELEPYRDRDLYLRLGICTLCYLVLWGTLGYATDRLMTGEIWQWLYVGPPFFIVGSLVALACFDLDFTNAFFHYSCYILLTIILRWVAGMPWPWQVPGGG